MWLSAGTVGSPEFKSLSGRFLFFLRIGHDDVLFFFLAFVHFKKIYILIEDM